ncbi:uncharacterized protein LOC115928456 [Strongylocentrotus purpuratus]|uniref:Uncharacterized protein n=1 Tax=Strongylocentrotus purpuratus TaxID=7668 RepID=A0A7M7PJ25_STRPU|nr:uncharacterized protein LOC115928456 [Strongylocentrotus purpuratus]
MSQMDSSTAAFPPSALSPQAPPGSAGATGSDGKKKLPNSSGKVTAGKVSKSGPGKAKSKTKSDSEPKAMSEKNQEVESTVPFSTFNNRLDKMEGLLARVVEALPATNATAVTGSSHPSSSRGPTGATGGEDYVQRPPFDHWNDIPPTGLMDFYGLPADATEAGAVSEEENFDSDMPQPDNFVIPSIAAKFAMASDIGDPIEEEIAQSTSYLMTHQLEGKVLDEVTAKYPAPSNCQIIEAPKVNPVIWDNLPPMTKSRDLKLQRVQKSLTHGINAFARSVSMGGITDTQQDALALICNANFELNCLRKELIKPDLNARFTHLCKPTLPATRLLFGDDLGKQVKDLKDQQLAAAGVMRDKFKNRFASHPYRGRGYNAPGHRWGSQSQSRGYSRPMSGSQGGPFLGYRQNRRGRQPPYTQSQAPNQPQMQAPGAQRGPMGQQRRK